MGIGDKAKEMKEKAEQHVDREAGEEKIDSAAEKVDQATDEKHSEHIDKAADAAKKRFNNP